MACWCNGNCPTVPPAQDLLKRGNRRGAERLLKLALTNAPNCPEANFMLAGILNVTNRGDGASGHIERGIAAEGDPFGWKGNALRGDNFRAQARPDQAVKAYELALAAGRERPDTVAGLISCLAVTDLERAEATAAAAIKEFPGHLEIIRVAAAVEAERKNFPAAAKMLEGDNRPAALLDRGRYLDRAGDYDGAWSCFMAGKMAARGRQAFNRPGFDRVVGGLMELATKRKQEAIPFFDPQAPKHKGPLPLFIMGFPRSGTTMIETAFSSHSKITAADELPFINELTRLLPHLAHMPMQYPDAMMSLGFGENETVLANMRAIYLAKAERRAGPWRKGAKLFTDKMPLNEMHLPLMARMFPDSFFLYVRRHPLDIILSNMSYGISHGFNYASSLESAAYAYAALDALLQKYRALFPWWEIRYENFVADHRVALDQAFRFIGLEPEPAAYDFHQNARHSRTISHRQVKEPLYDRSVGRYKNYLHHLAPIIEAVRPICEREGYAI